MGQGDPDRGHDGGNVWTLGGTWGQMLLRGQREEAGCSNATNLNLLSATARHTDVVHDRVALRYCRQHKNSQGRTTLDGEGVRIRRPTVCEIVSVAAGNKAGTDPAKILLGILGFQYLQHHLSCQTRKQCVFVRGERRHLYLKRLPPRTPGTCVRQDALHPSRVDDK